MTVEQYNELMEELNFSDNSVGISQLTLDDTENIKELLEAFNYNVIGLYETRNSKGFKFKDDQETYAIEENNDRLEIVKLIEL